MKKRVFIIIGVIAIVFFGVYTCAERFSKDIESSNTATDSGGAMDDPDINSDKSEEQNYQNRYDNMVRELKNLNNVENGNLPGIIVNDKVITKKETMRLIIQKKCMESKTAKSAIDESIRLIIINQDAESQNIKPAQEEVDIYMDNFHIGYNNGGSQEIDKFISDIGITFDEYVVLHKQSVYNSLQREMHQRHVTEVLDSDYDAYVDSLIENSDIKFVDTEIENMYNEY